MVEIIEMNKPTSVFVPFELEGTLWKKCDDLPRFLTSREVLDYLQEQGNRLSSRKLSWTECPEEGYIQEYLKGVGTTLH